MLSQLVIASLASLASLHGGAYPAPAPPPAPAGPSPGNAAPSPGGRAPGSPSIPASAPGPGGPLSGVSTQPGGLNELDWKRWWDLERERFLLLRDIEVEGPLSGASGTKATRQMLRPSRERIDRSILPPLLAVLESERDDSMISSALIAVARIGSGDDPELSARVGSAIQKQLLSKSQEVSETAALSLGILGEDAVFESLLALMASTPEGGKLVGQTSVPTRTRAFAAFGLGLMAHRRSEGALSQRIAAALMDVLADRHAADELPTAAALAMGLCPVPNRLTLPDQATRRSEYAQDVTARHAQIRWLLDRIETKRQGSDNLARIAHVHAVAALGRLATDARPQVRASTAEALMELARAKASPAYLRTAALMGLGHALNAGAGSIDRAGVSALSEVLKSGYGVEEHFASIALAQVTSRPGMAMADDGGVIDPWRGVDAGRRTLLSQLARGRAESQPWFALALGVQNWHLHRAGAPGDSPTRLALRDKIRTTRSAAFVGAYGIACALAHEGANAAERAKAGAQVYAAFERTKDPVARGQLALALGLLDHEPARDDLVELMERSRFQPELLWSTSVALALIQDPELTPKLVDTLKNARSASSRGAAAAALGDSRAIEPLLELLGDGGQSTASRAFAIVGLGLLCESTPLPWKTPAAHANPYFAFTATLAGNGRGLLDLN